jgi:hypothetical protein
VLNGVKMTQKKQKSDDDKYIAVDDLISRLGLLDVDVYYWLNRDKPKTKKDHRGRESVPIDFLEKYSSCAEYMDALKRAVVAERLSREADDLQITLRLKRERSELLDIYEAYIGCLEILHRKYLDLANKAGLESSAMAAYLLFTRVISTLKMGCLCLRNGHWTSGSLLREIDECLDVAKFFVITKGTSKGENALRKWFRQNCAPSHGDCRGEIAIWKASLNKETDVGLFRELLYESYQKKSKFTHPTCAIIREVTKYNAEGITSIEEVDYGPCSYERKLHELTHIFRSSIWSSFKTFFVCFIHELPLE